MTGGTRTSSASGSTPRWVGTPAVSGLTAGRGCFRRARGDCAFHGGEHMPVSPSGSPFHASAAAVLQITKVNEHNKPEERIIVITDRARAARAPPTPGRAPHGPPTAQAVYNVKPPVTKSSIEVQRRVALDHLNSVTIRRVQPPARCPPGRGLQRIVGVWACVCSETGDDFIVHIQNDYDYYFRSGRRAQIVLALVSRLPHSRTARSTTQTSLPHPHARAGTAVLPVHRRGLGGAHSTSVAAQSIAIAARLTHQCAARSAGGNGQSAYHQANTQRAARARGSGLHSARATRPAAERCSWTQGGNDLGASSLARMVRGLVSKKKTRFQVGAPLRTTRLPRARRRGTATTLTCRTSPTGAAPARVQSAMHSSLPRLHTASSPWASPPTAAPWSAASATPSPRCTSCWRSTIRTTTRWPHPANADRGRAALRPAAARAGVQPVLRAKLRRGQVPPPRGLVPLRRPQPAALPPHAGVLPGERAPERAPRWRSPGRAGRTWPTGLARTSAMWRPCTARPARAARAP
jgi:hypothetical protein